MKSKNIVSLQQQKTDWMDAYTLTFNTGQNQLPIFIGDWEKRLLDSIQHERTIFLTDENVYKAYASFLKKQKCIQITPGEQSKSLENLMAIYRKLIDLEADRGSLLIGFGGGVVTDIAGFIASTFMRGIRFAFVSTTLLGQVDAVIGGKNGVNLDGYKNMIGVFNQPEFIISDPGFFETLPLNEFINGLAEVIKQFLIADEAGLYWFKDNLSMIMSQDRFVLNELLVRQNKIKLSIVEQDEREAGIRKLLNFGHTFGHAIEKKLQWPHGQAVAAGMSIALHLSNLENKLSKKEVAFGLELIRTCELPAEIDFDLSVCYEYILKDKKKKGNTIDFILLERPGKAFIHTYALDELKKKISLLQA